MNTLSILSIPLNSALLSPSSSRNKILVCFSRSGFHQPQSIRKQTQIPIRFRLSFSSPVPNFSAVTENQLLDAEEDDDDEEDEDDEAAEEYDHDPVLDAAEEHEQSEDEEFETSSDELSTAFQSPETKFQRVQKLCNEVREFGEDIIDANELASLYDFRIDKFQRLAIKAFLRGSSVVVSAPTSSGKTLIAESAAAVTIAKGRRLFYTTPLKALSNQKFREFRQTFGDGNVGLLTGDSAVNKDAQVLIMTTEILRNMLYQSVGIISSGSGLFDVDAIVLDEVHYLSDISRGTVWEEIVIYCPKEVQLICLSATVANPDELAGWIGQIHGTTELVTSTRRPVPLTWHFSTKTSLFPLLDENGKTMNRNLSLNNLQLYSLGGNSSKDVGVKRRSTKRRQSDEIYDDIYSEYGMMSGRSTLSKNDMNLMRRSQVPQIGDTLLHLRGRDMLPAIWFIFSRKGCDAAVQYVEDSKLLDDCETSEVELALKRFRIQYPDAVRESAVKALLHGVAAHHAGCLPLWKSFIEDLFQQGLVKVVFATETLAAGINMPARTAVISSLSKRGESGRVQLRSSELLQMAGRAGRRGIDEKGHVVLIQSPYEGAEECCKLLFAGVEPLVSQFTASYGMVLNLLAGSKVTRKTNEEQGIKVSGRTLEEARKLVEKSFGNYLGSSVMIASKEELDRIQKEIAKLTSEISDDAIDKKSRMLLSATAYKEMAALQEALRIEKRIRSELRRSMELERMSSIIPLMKELGDGNLPFICLNYKDVDGVEHLVPAVYLAKIDALDGSKIKNAVLSDESFRLNIPELKTADDSATPGFVPSYHVALGSDNSWYIFTEKWIRTVYKTGFPNVSLNKNDPLPEEIMRMLLDKEEMKWENLANSELGGLWHIDGSLETWSWSLNVPMLSSLSEEDEVQELSQAYFDAVDRYKDQRNKVSRLKKKIARTEGFREYKKIVDMAKFSEEKIRRLKTKSNRLINRIKQIEPSGWKEFLQVSTVIHETRALDINTNLIFPLGETASAIRGENELWLAMVLRNKVLVNLKPPQLAAVCGSLVCEGIKIRPSKNNSYIYEASPAVIKIINLLEEQKEYLMDIQEQHGVKISCCLDSQFSGMVEAWASGLTWREIMMDCAMDEGDLARLLRRTIDLLAQIPKLPDIDAELQRNAIAASNVMDRVPISELAG